MTMLLCNTMQYILVSICPLTISTIYFFINCVADNAITPFWYISNIVEVAMWGRPWATNAYTALTLTSSTLSSCKKYNAVKRDQAVQENQRSSYEMTTTFVQLCVLNTAAPTAFACLMQTLHSDKLSRTQLSSSSCTLPVFCDIESIFWVPALIILWKYLSHLDVRGIYSHPLTSHGSTTFAVVKKKNTLI